MPPDMSSRDTVITVNPRIKALLHELHAKQSAQEASFGRLIYQVKFLIHVFLNLNSRVAWDQFNDRESKTQLLSHSKEKCELIYMLAILNKAKTIVECGTSFGLSTIYLALAVNHNAGGKKSGKSKVLTIEKDAGKVEEARRIWERAGPEVEDWIDMRLGDLREILENYESLPDTVDMLFLDAWTSLALPALKQVRPLLSSGAVIVVDKTRTGEYMYKDLLDYVRDPENGFISATLPYPEGLEVIIYMNNHQKTKESPRDEESTAT